MKNSFVDDEYNDEISVKENWHGNFIKGKKKGMEKQKRTEKRFKEECAFAERGMKHFRHNPRYYYDHEDYEEFEEEIEDFM